MKRTRATVGLMRKVAQKLRRLRHEQHYDQGLWIGKNECGTTACIGGWAALMTGWRRASLYYVTKAGRRRLTVTVAREALGLTAMEAQRLFGVGPFCWWPEPYAERWDAITNGNERPSRIAADLLSDLASGKVEL